jgi:hypothetical protein
MTYRIVWRNARRGAYPLTLRGWARVFGDLIDSTPGLDFYLQRGQFAPRNQPWPEAIER